MMSASEANGEAGTPLERFNAETVRLKRVYQHYLDRVVPHVVERWLGAAVLLALFELRIVVAQGVRDHIMTHNILAHSCILAVVYRFVFCLCVCG